MKYEVYNLKFDAFDRSKYHMRCVDEYSGVVLMFKFRRFAFVLCFDLSKTFEVNARGAKFKFDLQYH